MLTSAACLSLSYVPTLAIKVHTSWALLTLKCHSPRQQQNSLGEVFPFDLINSRTGRRSSPENLTQPCYIKWDVLNMLRIQGAVQQSHISTFGGIQDRGPSDQFSLIIPRNSKDIPFCRSTNPTSPSPAQVSTHQLPS